MQSKALMIFQSLKRGSKSSKKWKTLNYIFNRAEVQAVKNQFQNDDLFCTQLYPFKSNQNLKPIQRLNAEVLIANLNAPKNMPLRLFVKDFDWKDSDYTSGKLIDITFLNGNFRNVYFERVSFGGVVWSGDFSWKPKRVKYI